MIFFLLNLILPQCIHAQSLPKTSFGISQYVEQAVRQSLDVQSQQKIYENAKDNVATASQFFFPKLSLQSNFGLRQGSPEYPRQPETSDLSMELSSLLFDNGKSWARWDEALLTEQKEKLVLEKKRDEVALEAANRYLQYYRFLKTRELARGILSTVEKQSQVITSLYKQGLRTQKDYLRFEGQLLREQVRATEIDLEISKAGHGLKELAPDLRSEDLLQFDQRALPAVKVADEVPQLKDHREIRIFNFNQGIRDAQYRSQKLQIWPDVRISAKANYSSAEFLSRNSDARTEQRTLGGYLQASWTIWDWGDNQRKNSILARDLEVQSFQDRKLQLNIEKQLLDLASRKLQVNSFYSSSSRLLDYETRNYNLMESEYRQGKSTALDLITGVQSLSSAQVLKLNHEIEIRKIQYEILYHQGKIYEYFKESR